MDVFYPDFQAPRVPRARRVSPYGLAGLLLCLASAGGMAYVIVRVWRLL